MIFCVEVPGRLVEIWSGTTRQGKKVIVTDTVIG